MVREHPAVNTIGVVGAGTMGSGIAQVAATSNYDVVLCDIDEAVLTEAVQEIERGLDRAVENDRLTATDAETALDRVQRTTELEALEASDLVIETVVEEISIKENVFENLDEIVDDDVVLATNTSTLSITSLGSATDRPEQVVGLHFMNPVPRMVGVEIVVGEHTTTNTVNLAHDIAESLGKETWESDDRPGFVVNRVLLPWINEGIRAYDEGVASKEDIDQGMKLGTNVPMGPLELADHVGLDVIRNASGTLRDELGDRYRPPYLLKRKVEAGALGKKTGAGFYEY